MLHHTQVLLIITLYHTQVTFTHVVVKLYHAQMPHPIFFARCYVTEWCALIRKFLQQSFKRFSNEKQTFRFEVPVLIIFSCENTLQHHQHPAIHLTVPMKNRSNMLFKALYLSSAPKLLRITFKVQTTNLTRRTNNIKNWLVLLGGLTGDCGFETNILALTSFPYLLNRFLRYEHAAIQPAANTV